MPALAQKEISGKSQVTHLKITPEYKRGLPPILYVDMIFEDDNNNGIIEANENARLHLTISNKGKGPAQGLLVTLKSNINDPAFKIGDRQEIPFLYPDNDIQVTIPMQAGFSVNTAEHLIEINITEHFGYDMDPVLLQLSTLKFQEPKLEFAGIQIIDTGEGTGPLIQDGKLQAGELVKARIVVQNTGQNISKDTKFNIFTTDPNIYITEGQGNIGDLAIGEWKEIWVTISPNKRVTTENRLPVYITTSNDVARGNLYREQLPIYLDQRPAEIATVEIKADIDALTRQIARFEIKSDRVTANVGKEIDIRQILPSNTKRSDAVAVLIGLENYDHFVGAPYAENDVTIMRDYFRNVLGVQNILFYKSKDVTGYAFDNIFNPVFGRLQQQVMKGQTEVFVYYSGHGIPNKNGNKVYLLPTDGRVEAIEQQGYDLNQLFKNLLALEAKSVTVFLDACFSGISRTSENIAPQNLLAMKGVAIEPEIDEPWLANPNFTVFSSSGYNETSLGYDAEQAGLFTYYLCAGLQGKADADGDKKVTSGELENYVTRKVMETSRKIRGLQTPQFRGDRNKVLVEYQ